MKAKLNIDNWTSNFLLFRNWLVNNLILLLIFPLSIISIIFIIYGVAIEKVISKNPELFKLFQLKTQLKVLTYEIDIPSHVRCLGYDSIISLILLFFIWLLTHSFFCYFKLSRQSESKSRLLFETIVLLMIFIFIVSPNMPLTIIVLGYSALIVQIILIALYWGYTLKQK